MSEPKVVRRRRDGSIVLTLHDREVQVLRWVFGDLERVMGEGSNVDAVTERLFPRAYLDPTEEASEADWQSLVHDDLVESRVTALAGVVSGLDSAVAVAGRPGLREVVLDEERATQWLGIINDSRLAVGTALGVTAEWEFDALDPDEPNFELHALYAWLTNLLGVLLGVMPRGRK